MFTKEQYKEKLIELDNLKNCVSLDPDPISVGLNEFNKKLAEIESCRERVTSLILEAIWNRSEAQQLLDEAQADYDKKVQELLITPDIEKLRSSELRMARVNNLLKNELDKLRDIQKLYNFADAFLKSVQAVDKILESKNENLLQQIGQIKFMFTIDPSLKNELKKGE